MVAGSYVQASSREPGAVAELSANRKEAKYSMLTGTHIFQPLAFESHGPHNASYEDTSTTFGRSIMTDVIIIIIIIII